MYYEVFPFGKYKGVKLNELPSTYIVLSLEQFELPTELNTQLRLILFGRLKVFSLVKSVTKNTSKAKHLEYLDKMISEHENI